MGRHPHEDTDDDGDKSGDDSRLLRRKRPYFADETTDSPSSSSASKRQRGLRSRDPSPVATPQRGSHKDSRGQSPAPLRIRLSVPEKVRPGTPTTPKGNGSARSGRDKGTQEDGDHEVDVVGHSGTEEDLEWEPDSPITQMEKDYRHEEVFPMLHSKRNLILVHMEKKKKSGLSDMTQARGNRPSYLSREVDFSHVPKPSFREIEEAPVLRELVTPGKKGMSKKDARDPLLKDPFHEETSSAGADEPFQRYIVPPASYSDNLVEYDMDEQDSAWLNIYNEERRQNDLPEISEDVFELLIDRIEKEWYSHSQASSFHCVLCLGPLAYVVTLIKHVL